jgi:hypothetical protein
VVLDENCESLLGLAVVVKPNESAKLARRNDIAHHRGVSGMKNVETPRMMLRYQRCRRVV